MGLGPVDELGAALEEEWCRSNYDPVAFPELAVRALARARLPDKLPPDDIVAWALETRSLPAQRDLEAKFGQPPVTMFRAPRFHIDALYWLDGSTTIHQHSFSGAFQVLAGSSIETRYRFEPERTFDGHFVIGKLQVVETSLNAAGAVTPIRAGVGGLIHALFHLERPSVSIVVRTFLDVQTGPQFNYARPGVGHDPFFVESYRDRALQLVTMLRRIEHPAFERLVGDLIARSDLHMAYRVLGVCADLSDAGLFARLLDRVSDRPAAAVFEKAFHEARRMGFLSSRRALIKDPELRFFLGVLLNATRREDALALVHARAPEAEPAAKTAAWVRRLSTVNAKLQAAGLPWEPNLLGLPEFNDALEAELARELGGPVARGAATRSPFIAKLAMLPALASLF
jgi:hypothetical protein